MPLPRRVREERGRTSGGCRGSVSGGEAPPLWLRTVPDMDHVSDDYGDAPDEHGVVPATYQALERYLPSTIRAASREQKLAVMRRVLVGEDPAVLRARQRQRDYMEAIQSAYQVDRFQRWAYIMNQRIVRGNHMDKRSVNLSDFGLETMLDDLVKDFIAPIIKGRYPELGALSLDSHHTFVTSYIQGEGEGFHVDDSEVTVNVCIGGEFTGGDMYFRGIRCGDHVSCEIQNEIL
ncbi:hypothetical protein PR202_ga23252 [Eleusine coracana subsp. coracana]|uniref:PKHD-type hydroxylase n=1 Tax=Eleusine coracana subsp. coracana TaxID=191504 RepID=A0AAV5D6D3_ELECO|nr:hypothetical protein PR202_ga23252 [Eleusine coracana subsp. coracana]